MPRHHYQPKRFRLFFHGLIDHLWELWHLIFSRKKGRSGTPRGESPIFRFDSRSRTNTSPQFVPSAAHRPTPQSHRQPPFTNPEPVEGLRHSSASMDHLRNTLDRKRSGRPMNFVPPTVRQVKWLIWLYFWLLIFEGALRKWALPQLSDPLLIIRDPVVLLIYFQAIRGGFFPQHWLVKTTIALGVVTFFWGCIHLVGGSYLTLLVTLYGVRTYFLHLPLIFIMGYVFTRRDVINLGRWMLYLSIPMAVLMVAQYQAAPTSFLNRGTTGEESGQLMAALGKVRPPGTFSFISGPALYYPLASVFIFMGIMYPRLYPKWLIISAAVATALVMPLSGSRTLVLSIVLVAGSCGIYLIRFPGFLPRFTVWAVFIVMGVAGIFTLPVGQQAVQSFSSRWNDASLSEGKGEGADAAITNRLGGTFIEVFQLLPNIPIAGYGIGAGTNVGVKLLTGGVGFMLGEAEWTRNVMEAGPLLGFAYIGFRITLAVYILGLAWLKISKRDPLGWLIIACGFPTLIFGTTSQSTILGFMAFTAGLSLAAIGVMQNRHQISENQRRFLVQKARHRQNLGSYRPPTPEQLDERRPLPDGVLRPR